MYYVLLAVQELGVVEHVKMRRGCDLDGSENKEQKKTDIFFSSVKYCFS